MPRPSRAMLLGAALIAAAGPPVAGAATAPVSGKVPAVLVVAAPTRLTVTMPAAARKVPLLRVRLLLSTSKTAAAGVEIGTVTARNVPAHHSRRVIVTATVPTGRPGASAYLIGCVRAGTAKERCVLLRRVALSVDASQSALIEAQRAAGMITTSVAIHRLSASLHSGHANDDSLARFDALWPLASAADRAFMLPTYLPPGALGSAWTSKPAPAAASQPRAHRAGGTTCANYTSRSQEVWDEEAAAAGKVLFHFRPSVPKSTRDAWVKAMTDTIYDTLTANNGFKYPAHDGNVTCWNGGDSRLDIWVDPTVTSGGGAFTQRYAPGANDPCSESPTPVFIDINPKFGLVALAHEFFHAVQNAYSFRKTCAGSVDWLLESTAVWAEYFTYPRNGFTLSRTPAPIRTKVGFGVPYASWVFWYAMAHDHGGAKVIKDALEALDGAKPQTTVAAVGTLDGALDIGLRKGLEDFAAYAWNQDPIGAPGFPYTDDYRTWQIESNLPSSPRAPTPLQLAGATLKTVQLGLRGTLAFGDRRYTSLTIPDAKVRELRWTNGFSGLRGLDVQAYLHVSGGTWRVEDWSLKPTVTLCRDEPGDNVDKIIIATTNADIAGLVAYDGFPPDTMRLRSQCAFPTVFTGTWTRTIESPSSGWKETITGDARFVREPLLPDIAEQLIPIPYNLDHASATWVVTGHTPGGGNICVVTYSGQGTETSFNDADAYDKTRLVLQDATAYLQIPSATPFYYAIDVLGKRLHPPKYDITGTTVCGGGRQEVTSTDYLDIGLFQDASAITPGDPLLETSGTTRTLAGTRTYTDVSIGDNVITDTWSFAGTD